MVLGFWFIVMLVAGAKVWQVLRDRRNTLSYQRTVMSPEPHRYHGGRRPAETMTQPQGAEANSPA